MTAAAPQKKPALEDWHPADVIASLRKAGWSMKQLGHAHGYEARTSLTNALRRPYPKAEAIIASALGVSPQTIWPSRYNSDGTPARRGGMRPMRPANAKPTTHLRANTRTRKAMG